MQPEEQSLFLILSNNFWKEMKNPYIAYNESSNISELKVLGPKRDHTAQSENCLESGGFCLFVCLAMFSNELDLLHLDKCLPSPESMRFAMGELNNRLDFRARKKITVTEIEEHALE